MDIRVENLDYVYNAGTPLEIGALSGISFAVAEGKFLGLLGGTGSGKTTLIKNLNGLLLPTRGRVLVDGIDTGRYGPSLRRKIGIVFQRPERQLFEETVFRDISFVLRRFSGLSESEIRSRVYEVCEIVKLDIDEVGERSPFALSDGEKRKAAIAGVLLNDPEVLILDEPAVGLDPPAVGDFLSILRDLKQSGKKSVVLVSHDLESFLPVTDELLVLHKGRVTALGAVGKVCDQLSEDAETRELLPGTALFVHDLRKAGIPVEPGDYSISHLADQIASFPKG